ncbi:MAG TPA: excinuclease ABC subunit A [Rhodospirillales bacterium]|nr:excinuclease ABC subunit A [Rhodospirillales bacterium]
MIKSFKCRHTAELFDKEASRKFALVARTALRKLYMLHAAGALNDLRVPPANRLEALKGKRKGQWSIRINDQYRVCFVWKDGDAFEVEVVDYH